MFTIFHRLFGWHYIGFQHGFSGIVRRVRVAPNGTRYVRAYGESYYLSQDGTLKSDCGYKKPYTPLTWNNDK
jgi:hypothetical protein